MDSHYDKVRSNFEGQDHRNYVGGMWDELGLLQFSFLKSQGLLPHHFLIDVGCGSLRGGRHFINYLQSGHYFGTDINPHLIEKGRSLELDEALQQKVGDDKFIVSTDFDVSFEQPTFDYGIALSVFTHLRRERIELCLNNLRKKFNGGAFFATFFFAGKSEYSSPLKQKRGIVTHPDQDPFHYTEEQIRDIAKNTNWQCEIIGDFEHPRNQQMLKFT